MASELTAGTAGGPVHPRAARRGVATLLLALLLLSLAVQLAGVFRRNINWDEFLFLANIYRAGRGEPVGLLQTSYVHLFGWLPRVGADAIAQITVARLLYLGIWIVSLMLLLRLGRRLLDPLSALAGTTLFALFSYSLDHAVSFRVDGLLLPLLLAVAILLLNPTTGRAAIAGALAGLALALSVKAVLWAPALVAILVLELRGRPGRWRPPLAGAAAAALVFGAAMLAHQALLAAAGAPPPALSGRGLSAIGNRMLLEEGLLPRWVILANAILRNLVISLFVIAGLGLTVRGLRQPDTRARSLRLLLLCLPFLSIAFYANAWPYAYLVLFPPLGLLAGRAVAGLARQPARFVIAVALLCATAQPAAMALWEMRVDGRARQRDVVDTVASLFPEPVPYLDRTGMIPGFPRALAFPLTRVGLSGYLGRGEPVVAQAIREQRPPLLIVNTPVLDVWGTGVAGPPDPGWTLLPEDRAALEATYAPYWGAVWLAGRQWRDLEPATLRSFEIVIAGEYTLLAQHPVALDGRAVEPGTTVRLYAGPHALRTTGAEPDLRILWGRGIVLPVSAPSPLPVFAGF